MPPENMLAELSDTMEKFVINGFQIAKKDFIFRRQKGGLDFSISKLSL